MGIQGLLKELSSVTSHRYLSEYHGVRVAVDGYVWLHRAVFHCASDIAKNKGTTAYVKSFASRVQQLLRHEMVVTVVFDGASLPAKRVTETSRELSRAEALQKAVEFEQSGQHMLAKTWFAKAVDVIPQMAYEVACALKDMGVQVVVAPYEADAQLAYLSRHDLVDLVISEDSDLLVYGCKRVLYKLDLKTERGQEIRHDDIFTSNPFSRLTHDTFLLTAVLSGCDYLPSLASIGIKGATTLAIKAQGLIARTGVGITCENFLTKVMMLIRLSGVPDEVIGDDFVQKLQRALLTFRHQVVFSTIDRCLQHLTPIGPDFQDTSFLGEVYDSATACAVADCLMDPESKRLFVPQVCLSHKEQKPRQLKNVKTKQLTQKPVKVDAQGMRTLTQCWTYSVPVSVGATADFVDPVIELSDSEDGSVRESPDIALSDSNLVLEDLERFSATDFAPESKRTRVCDENTLNNIFQVEFVSFPSDRMLIPTRFVGTRILVFQQRRMFSFAPTEQKVSLFTKAKNLFVWLRQTAKEKGKPFIAWYVSLYLGGLVGSYGIVRAYGEVEPDVVKDWARTFHMDRLVDLETVELTKTNCEYLAALLLNEAMDTPRLILAVLTVDRVILLGKKILRRGA